MQSILTIDFSGLAAFIAIGNLCGVILAVGRRRIGESGGFSTVPLLSISFAATAHWIGPDPLGLWVWPPAVLDPSTWSLAYLPLYLVHPRGT